MHPLNEFKTVSLEPYIHNSHAPRFPLYQPNKGSKLSNSKLTIPANKKALSV